MASVSPLKRMARNDRVSLSPLYPHSMDPAILVAGIPCVADRAGDEGEEHIAQQPGPAYDDLAQSDWAPARPKGRQCHANHASARRAHGRAVIAARAGLRGRRRMARVRKVSISCEGIGEVPPFIMAAGLSRNRIISSL